MSSRPLRKRLANYIRRQFPKTSQMNPNELIDSKNTAVVELYGVIPQLASKGDTFDLMIRTIPRTQTTSIRGGRLDQRLGGRQPDDAAADDDDLRFGGHGTAGIGDGRRPGNRRRRTRSL